MSNMLQVNSLSAFETPNRFYDTLIDSTAACYDYPCSMKLCIPPPDFILHTPNKST